MAKRARRWTEAERQETLQRFESSGLKQAEFCRQEGVSVKTLSYWRRRERERAADGFVEVSASSSGSAELEFPGGVTIRWRW